VRSTTSDQTLIDAMNFIMAHEHDPKKYAEATIDLSFASAKRISYSHLVQQLY
jgi:hypothetical protein